jgi:hypothetical protein
LPPRRGHARQPGQAQRDGPLVLGRPSQAEAFAEASRRPRPVAARLGDTPEPVVQLGDGLAGAELEEGG